MSELDDCHNARVRAERALSNSARVVGEKIAEIIILKARVQALEADLAHKDGYYAQFTLVPKPSASETKGVPHKANCPVGGAFACTCGAETGVSS